MKEDISSFLGNSPINNHVINTKPNSLPASPWKLHTGYDAAGMQTAHLVTRRDLIEQLDAESVFDYLQQNGVLNSTNIEQIKREKTAAKVNIVLLKLLDEHGKGAVGLFVNALRISGQHHLANLLDDSIRLNAFSGSGYLSRKRHKGQVSLLIEVRCIKLLQDEHEKLLSDIQGSPTKELIFIKEWISLENIQKCIKELQEPVKEPDPPLTCTDVKIEFDEPEKKLSCLSCLCISKLFRKKKTKSSINEAHNNKQLIVHTSQQISHPKVITSVTNTNVITYKTQIETVSQKKNDDIKRLQKVENAFREKADKFYDIVKNTNDQPYINLVKYFEQEREILVLETYEDEPGLVVVSVCMKAKQLEKLSADFYNGKLNKDVEKCVLNENILQTIGVRSLKLFADIDTEEFDMAENELR